MKFSVVSASALVVSAAAVVLHKQAPVAPAAAVAAPAPVPMFNKDTMPGVSTTMKCIMNLAAQYFIIYTALAIVRTMNQMKNNAYKNAQSLIEVASKTVVYAPMLSVLFLGTRMRAIQLAQGETEKYNLPQGFVQSSMNYATWAVLAQVILVLLVPLLAGGSSVPTDEEGNVDTTALKNVNKGALIALNVAKYLALLGLYGGVAGVIYGVYSMEGPDAIWNGKAPAVSPAVDATVNLSAQFFVIYTLQAVIRTWKEFKGGDFKKLEASLQLASYTVNFAPMLCVLFIGARMRALQIDPKNGNPQSWAQNCFYLCAYSILVQALLVIFLPYLSKDITCSQGDYEGDIQVKGLTGVGAHVFSVVRWAALLALYGGFSAVVYSIFTIQNPVAAVLTPALSPALQCVMGLALQYFFVYLVLFVAKTTQNFYSVGGKVASVMEQARGTVMYAPMLSVLFIGARMRALQLTKANDGSIPAGAGPYLWMQDNMYYTVWAVFTQLVLTIVMSCLYDVSMDQDGNVKEAKGASPWVGHTINVVRYGSMAAMYGGSVAILYGTGSMTPETLPPYASQAPLIPGVKVVGPPLPATPGQAF